jgi:succinate dehydrogenase / fumarate reductase flavoprotein subunit
LNSNWSIRPTNANIRSSSSAPAWPVSAASATLAELGYNVKAFCIQDSPRRAHSIAAQGGINAAKNYPNDGDSIWRLFYDTVKGGDFRAREANVYRLAQVSNRHHRSVRGPGHSFARDYGGLLANRSPLAAPRSREPSTPGAKRVNSFYWVPTAPYPDRLPPAKSKCSPAAKCWTSSWSTDQAKGIVVRNLITGEMERHAADAVVLATGGYGNVFFFPPMPIPAMSGRRSKPTRKAPFSPIRALPRFTRHASRCIRQRLSEQADPDE